METESSLRGDEKRQRVSERAARKRGSIRALIVNDSPFVVRSVGLFLKGQKGVEVVGSAANGQEAVQRVAVLRPDLVMMDVRMPEMDGLEATRRIKRRRALPVVIIFALEDSEGCRLAAKTAGADAFVGKVAKGVSRWRAAIRRAFPGVTGRESEPH